MSSIKDVINVLISVVLIAFIGLNLFRLAAFFLEANHLI